MIKRENISEFDSQLQSLADASRALGSYAVADFLIADTMRERTGTIVTSMAETLELESGEIRLVIVEPREGSKQIAAIDASPMGQRIGTYKAIYERRAIEPAWYKIEVDGELVDPLAGCTRAAYNAMIADARVRGVLLPDSLALSQQTGQIWTATMLTGEPLDEDGLVILASSNSDDKVNNVGFPLDRGGKSIRVRPTIVVSELGI
jgi:hypothetical protein